MTGRRLVVAPIEAACDIWRIARLAPSAEPRLRVFVGLASEWDDDPDNRASYEEEMPYPTTPTGAQPAAPRTSP